MASTVTLAEVRRWDPQGLDAAARGLYAARDGLEELRSRLAAARPDEARWQGVAAERARAAHDACDNLWGSRTRL